MKPWNMKKNEATNVNMAKATMFSSLGVNGNVCKMFGMPSRGRSIRAAFTLFLFDN